MALLLTQACTLAYMGLIALNISPRIPLLALIVLNISPRIPLLRSTSHTMLRFTESYAFLKSMDAIDKLFADSLSVGRFSEVGLQE